MNTEEKLRLLRAEFPSEFAKKAVQKIMGKAKKVVIVDERKIKLKTIYLNSAGDLYKEPKTKYCYPMGEKSDRHGIVRYLVMHRGYQPTSGLSNALGRKSEQSIRTEIGKIRKKATRYLKIGEDKIVEGKKDSGYRINPKYKIVQKD